VELHVLTHEELRFGAPEIAVWEQFPGCGNPICDQPDHPEDQCRFRVDLRSLECFQRRLLISAINRKPSAKPMPSSVHF
jgi:hypothetical protein